MITIVNYDREASKPISKVLTEIDVEHKVSTKEKDIISAKKIILPNGADIRVIFKKLQLLNMYSLLKMVKKPVLGIGTGMFLMCDNLDDVDICGLGMLPVSNLSKIEHTYENSIEIKHNGKSKIFEGIDKKSEFIITSKYKIPLSEHTTATLIDEGVEYSAAIEKDNRFGVLFSPSQSGKNGTTLLSNFANL